MVTYNSEGKLSVWDFVAIVVYFAAVIGAGLYVSLGFFPYKV